VETDPRDLPGTDDHVRLVHPHGDAHVAFGVYRVGDLASFSRASVGAHASIAAAYIEEVKADPTIPTLCRGCHVEALVDGAGEVLHSLRGVILEEIAKREARDGYRLGVLRAWRHIGEDCEAAEARIDCDHTP
jgi:hypothetical protein